jgi:hypothetical protein
MCALGRAGVCGAKVTGLTDGTNLEVDQCYVSCGQATRTVRAKNWRRPVHEIAVTIWGWNILRWIDASTKISLAVKVSKMYEHATHMTRALATQAQTNPAGAGRLYKSV